MANRTVKDAVTVKGTNPQFLVEKIIRHRIYDCRYWKEFCFGLTAELIVDRGMELRFIGGIYAGNVKPTPFLCIILKMLQIQPDKEIIIEFIQQEEFKYIRALAAVYLRLTFTSVEIYKYLEPLYNDFRKLRYMTKEGRFELVHMDELIDHLLRDERYCDIQLPRLQKREALEEVNALEPYRSVLYDDLANISASDSEDEDKNKKKDKPRLISKRRSRSRDREQERDRDYAKEKEREKMRERRGTSRERERNDRDRGSRRDRSGSRDRKDRDRERDRVRRNDDRDRHHRDKGRDNQKDRDRDSHRDKDRGKDKKKDGDSMSVEETNKLRASLGMAPLK